MFTNQLEFFNVKTCRKHVHQSIGIFNVSKNVQKACEGIVKIAVEKVTGKASKDSINH
jgi:hypothetical protein